MPSDPKSLLSGESPLSEATPDSIDELLDRINNHLAEGMPDKISDDDLIRLVEAYRQQAVKWTAEVAETGRAPRGSNGGRKKTDRPSKAIEL